MLDGIATTVGLLVYGAFLAPLAWAMTKGRQVPAAPYAIIIVALAVYNTGIFQRTSLTRTDDVVLSAASASDSQCARVLELMRESNFVVDLSDSAAPKLSGPGVEQVPAQVRDVLIECSRDAQSEVATDKRDDD